MLVCPLLTRRDPGPWRQYANSIVPEDTEVGTKLWGQAAELQRTVDFLAATGLRI